MLPLSRFVAFREAREENRYYCREVERQKHQRVEGGGARRGAVRSVCVTSAHFFLAAARCYFFS